MKRLKGRNIRWLSKLQIEVNDDDYWVSVGEIYFPKNTAMYCTFIKRAPVELAENVGNRIGSSSWQWKILGALKWQYLFCLCLFSSQGSLCPERSRKPCFRLCLFFFLLPFFTFSLWLLASCSALSPLCFPDAAQTPVTPVPQICYLCSVHLQPFCFLHWENTAHLFGNQKNKKQIIQPIQIYICGLSMCSLEQCGEMKTHLTRRPRPELGSYLMAFLRLRKEQLSLWWVCCFFVFHFIDLCSFIFSFISFGVIVFLFFF